MVISEGVICDIDCSIALPPERWMPEPSLYLAPVLAFEFTSTNPTKLDRRLRKRAYSCKFTQLFMGPIAVVSPVKNTDAPLLANDTSIEYANI